MSGQSAKNLYADAGRLSSVFPPLLIDAEHVAQSVWLGVHGRRRAGRGESFWQFRRYDKGDPAERIDWRQSARTDKLYIREREWEATQNVCLWGDKSGSMQFASDQNLRTKADQAQLFSLALASLLLRGGEKVLWSERQGFASINNKGGLEEIAGRKDGGVPSPLAGRVREGLANYGLNRNSPPLIPPASEGEDPVEMSARNQQSASMPPLPPKIRHAHMILASDFLMPENALQERMQAYVAMHMRGALLHIVDPLEESFALDGRVELQDTEGDLTLLLPNAGSVRDAYRQRFAEHQEKLLRMAESAGWFYLRHITSEPPQQTLLRLYQYLAG